MVDFSIIKNIDFTNSDNLLFFSIFLILAIILFIVILAVFFELFHTAKKFLSKGKEVKKQTTNYVEEKKEDAVVAPKMKINGGDFFVGFKSSQKPEEIKKEILMPSASNDKEPAGHERIEIPTAKNTTEQQTGEQKLNETVVIEQGKKATENMRSLGFTAPTQAEEKIDKTEKNIFHESLNNKSLNNVVDKIKNTPELKKDTTIFKGRESLKMKEAVYNITKKTTPTIKGGLGGTYTLKERQEIAKKISDFKKFGGLLQKSDRDRIYKTLAKEKLKASPSERMKINKQERFLKNVIGK